MIMNQIYSKVDVEDKNVESDFKGISEDLRKEVVGTKRHKEGRIKQRIG